VPCVSTMKRVAALMTLIALVVASCGGGADPVETTLDQSAARSEAAEEYAVSADRALDDTVYEDLSPQALTDLIVDLCGGIGTSPDPDSLVAGSVAAIDPGAGAGDSSLLLEVVAIGLSEVCPEEVFAAGAAVTGGGDPEDAFAAVVIPVAAAAAGVDAPPATDLFLAGNAICVALDAGATPDAAALSAIDVLFGVQVDSLAEAGSQVPPWAGDVVGTVLGAAATILCPEHAETVAGFTGGA